MTKLTDKRFKTNCLKIKSLIMLSCLLIISLGEVRADQPPHIYRSVRALGMGNAFTAVANDEKVLFYNPAGLQKVKRHIFEIITANLTVNDKGVDLIKEMMDSDSEFLNDMESVRDFVKDMPGNKLYGEVNLGFLSLTAPGWGYSVFAGAVLDLTIHNPTVPYIDTNLYGQAGVIGGYALSFLDNALDVGLNLKYITRSGIDRDIHVSEFLKNDDSAKEYWEDVKKDITENNVKSKISPDIGFIYNLEKTLGFDLQTALVLKNIGGMDFGEAGEIPMTIDVGTALHHSLAGFDFILAADYVDLANKTVKYRSFLRNLKLGAEAGLWRRSNGHHFLSLRVGMNGPYPTFGASINVPYFPLKVDYAFWSEEIGYLAGDNRDERHSLEVSFNF